eukprot:gnl/Trimastix_PCT/743.p1 GENE.gnl/Trimastix_PCT/743~~gnl/Trimastix_PCT/743.p1  ORF type:complete len:420 (+),score=109.80 gnl/Trimastix_PCT/743:47-1306(+)
MSRLLVLFSLFLLAFAQEESLFVFDSLPTHYDKDLSPSQKYSVLEPIIFVPGLSGSGLDAKLDKESGPHWYCDRKCDWFNIWIAPQEFLPGVIDCWKENFGVHYCAENDTYHSTSGVAVRPRDYGGIKGVRWLDPGLPELTPYTEPMMQYFIKAGYVPGKTLFAAPYDFRVATPYATNRQFAMLRDLVESAFRKSGGLRVHLIGHSLGGPFVHVFLSEMTTQAWRDQYVASYISLAGPLGGSLFAPIAAITPTPWRAPIPPEVLCNLIRRFASVAWMAPAPTCFGDEPLVLVRGKPYRAAEIPLLLADAGLNTTALMLNRMLPSIGILKAPGVASHMFYSVSQNTTQQMNYPEGDFSKYPSPTKMVGGDGVVTEASLRLFEQWPRQAQPVVPHIVVDSHVGMMFKQSLWDSILAITARA